MSGRALRAIDPPDLGSAELNEAKAHLAGLTRVEAQ
jgi:hypothetical protein